ncbi:MAG: ATP-binding cassette domain-containing protein [Deltaproteobacteria bacterium]|nr:ATP-binding cassette domain-containing protein [Deltaproteobacteria bacterium]
MDSAREPIIRFRGVTKSFGRNVVFDGLDLDVLPGETLVVLGGSGQGKSVLLKLLLRLLRVDSGSIVAFDEEVTTLPQPALAVLRRRIAMLFQGSALFDSMSVEENIAYPLLEHGVRDPVAVRARVGEVLGMVGLPGIERLLPSALSGGMRKRVGLARAIAFQPDVILYDEPTTGLDPINVRRINGLIRSLQARLGVTSIVVTHDIDSAFTVGDRFAMVWEHRIGFTGRPEETRTCPWPWVREFVAGGRGVLEADLVPDPQVGG